MEAAANGLSSNVANLFLQSCPSSVPNTFSTCHVGMKSALCLTRSNTFCNSGLIIVSSCILKICPIFKAAPIINIYINKCTYYMAIN